MYILQECLFSFEELQKIESKERLPLFFSALDLRPYAKELRSGSPRGAEGHSREGILRALKTGSDDLGRIAAKFNLMVNRMNDTMRKVQEASQVLTMSAKNLNQVSEQNNAQADRITSSINENN
ncbi:hypothetical protein A8990_10442 [Paenibacillus taihuensis]|uniref:Methyl-accepting chemotaxis protein n=1 Tax=Paenibacillus taihuensis TaxID=1156355 RepID=A0A3D9SGX5_9BACL|nr:hypothetical protein A8990_10442 [Paenibacillus taihuensis]